MDSSQQDDQKETPRQDVNQQQQRQQHVILFYKYHPLSDDPMVTDEYRWALHSLCQSLRLTGRILVGCSSTSEGINGTLAGSYGGVKAFTVALLQSLVTPIDVDATDENGAAAADRELLDRNDVGDPQAREAVISYRDACRTFFKRISCPVLALAPHEFKWSAVPPSTGGGGDDDVLHHDSGPSSLFPDLNIKLVDELIGSGGVMKQVSIGETSRGYLTPEQWHDAIATRNPKDTVLIDCRNHKEYEIGHFESAVNPQTTTYSQFPQWVEQNQHLMENKTVYMYCTGGVRCEKSAAYIRRVVPSAVGVHHLQGGIHKYLETYGGGSDASGGVEATGGVGNASEEERPLWKGRNFVFDGRGAASAEETFSGREGQSARDQNPAAPPTATSCAVVGRCCHCDQPFDRFDPHCVCTVCREPTLVCTACQKELVEFHCRQHHHLRQCYFFDLSRFSVSDLERQIQGLHCALADIAVGKRFKSKRKTLMKQITKVQNHVSALRSQERDAPTSPTGLPPCRNCGDLECSGRCWGYYGLKRKQVLETQSLKGDASGCRSENGAKQARMSESTTLATASTKPTMPKGRNRQDEIDEIVALGLYRPPIEYRDAQFGIRVVPPVTRTVQCRAKGKWCGRLAVHVLKEELAELSRPGVLNELLERGLLRINNTPLDLANSTHVRVRMQDTLSRVLHWHEPPVQVPEVIAVQRIRLDDSVLREYGIDTTHSDVVYVINKPASVPVHPAGPYLANSLTVMVEAQENLSPTTLVPLHRTDRATSGLTLCATNPAVSRIFHQSLSIPGAVHKLYLAKVCGRFYYRRNDDASAVPTLSIGSCRWLNDRVLQVDAPVETTDPANGIRTVASQGKPSVSLFRLVSYDSDHDTSLVACVPVTGRNHQLRVHLQLLECPVLGDVQYGGRSWDESLVSDEVSRNLLLQSASLVNKTNTCAPALTEGDVESARKACRLCRLAPQGEDGNVHSNDGMDDDVSSIFSAPQLLRGGHAIALHALRYRVSMPAPPSKKNKSTRACANESTSVDKDEEEDGPLWVCDARVDPPSWWWADDDRHHPPLSSAALDLDALFEELSDLASLTVRGQGQGSS